MNPISLSRPGRNLTARIQYTALSPRRDADYSASRDREIVVEGQPLRPQSRKQQGSMSNGKKAPPRDEKYPGRTWRCFARHEEPPHHRQGTVESWVCPMGPHGLWNDEVVSLPQWIQDLPVGMDDPDQDQSPSLIGPMGSRVHRALTEEDGGCTLLTTRVMDRGRHGLAVSRLLPV